MFFRDLEKNSLKSYGLCQSHYLSATALSWDATRNMIKVELEFIPDPDIDIFFTRSGASYVSNKYSKASKKYLKSSQLKQQST